MKPSLTFTLDLEDHRPDARLPKRYPHMVDDILSFLDEQNIRATIFTVGTLAEQDPDCVKRFHGAGHEIAHHSYDHTPLTRQGADDFRHHTKRAKNILEDIIGEKILGYRAPIFSLTRQSLWAIDILKELGFSYSSSVLPAANPLHGLPGAPLIPFRWSNGLVEIPAPTGRLAGFSLPYLGGFYMRYLPFSVIKRQMAQADPDSLLWTYCHPYDFDAGEKNWRIKGASAPVSALLWFNRKNTFEKLKKITSHCAILPPFRDQDFSRITQHVDPATI